MSIDSKIILFDGDDRAKEIVIFFKIDLFSDRIKYSKLTAEGKPFNASASVFKEPGAPQPAEAVYESLFLENFLIGFYIKHHRVTVMEESSTPVNMTISDCFEADHLKKERCFKFTLDGLSVNSNNE